MTDLANLGIRVEAQEATTAATQLDDLAASADRAEVSTENLSAAARGLNMAVMPLLSSIDTSTRQMLELAQADRASAEAMRLQRDQARQSAEANRAAANAERDAAAAANEQQRAINRLLGSTDPLQAAINGVNIELREAERLYEAGAIDMATYARAQQILTTRLNGMRAAQMGHRREMGLSRHEALNLGRQFTDVGVSLASGMPMYLIAIQQGAQIGEVFAEARTRGVSFSSALGSLGRGLAPLARGLGIVGAAVGLVTGGFALFHRSIHGSELDDLTTGMGLTAEQLERVEDRTVSMGDTFRAVISVTADWIMSGPIGDAIRWLGDAWGNLLDWMGNVAFDQISNIVAVVMTGTTVAVQAVMRLPSAVGEILGNIANTVLDGIEFLVRKTLEGINWAIDQANRIPGVEINHVGQGFEMGRFAVAEGSMDSLRYALGTENILNIFRNADDAVEAGMNAFGNQVRGRAEQFARDRIREQAGEAEETREESGGGRDGGARRRAAEEAVRELERRISASERFLANLRQETAEIGLNAIQIRMMAVETAAAEAPTVALAEAIRTAGQEWRAATLEFERSEVTRQINENTLALMEEAEMIQLEADLIGASNSERERQLAMLAAELELRRQARAHFLTTGENVDFVNTPEGQRYIQQAGQNAIDSAANADMQALHDTLASTFSSAFQAAARGDWRGVFQTILQAIFDNVLNSMSQQFASFFSSRQGGGSSWLNFAAQLFGGGNGTSPITGGPPVVKAPAIEVPIKAAMGDLPELKTSMPEVIFRGSPELAAPELRVGALPELQVANQRPLDLDRTRPLESVARLHGLEQADRNRDTMKSLLVVEFREGDGFGGKVVEYAGPLAVEAGKQAVRGGSMQAQSDIGRRSRNRLGQTR